MVLEEARDSVSSVWVNNSRNAGSASGSPNGHEVWTGSVDGMVRCYDVRAGMVSADTMPGPVTSVVGTRDGKCVLVGCLDGKIRLMDKRDGRCLQTFPAEKEKDGTASGYKNSELRLKCDFGMGEAIVMSGSEGDGKVRAWDVLSAEEVGSVQASTDDKVVSVVTARDTGKKVDAVWACGGADGVVRVYGNH